jgi:hypothetical protein
MDSKFEPNFDYVINHSSKNLTRNQIQVNYEKEFHYLDVSQGIQLNPEIIDNNAVISFPIESNGFGAVFTANQKILPKNFHHSCQL